MDFLLPVTDYIRLAPSLRLKGGWANFIPFLLLALKIFLLALYKS
jgi:hypothetical protein